MIFYSHNMKFIKLFHHKVIAIINYYKFYKITSSKFIRQLKKLIEKINHIYENN